MRSSASAPRFLGEGDIHIWLARLVEDEDCTEKFVSLLDRREAARAARFLYKRRRMHFVQSHGIVRRILPDMPVSATPPTLCLGAPA